MADISERVIKEILCSILYIPFQFTVTDNIYSMGFKQEDLCTFPKRVSFSRTSSFVDLSNLKFEDIKA